MFNILAICIGACLGALSRWWLGLWLSSGAALPWGTLAANLIGGYLIGIFVALFQSMARLVLTISLACQSRLRLPV